MKRFKKPSDHYRLTKYVTHLYNKYGEKGWVLFFQPGAVRDLLIQAKGSDVTDYRGVPTSDALKVWAVPLMATTNKALVDLMVGAEAEGVEYRYSTVLGTTRREQESILMSDTV